MNRAPTLVLASAIALIASTNASHADSLFMNSSPSLEQTLRSFAGNFDIQQYYNWDESYPGDGPLSVEQRTPQAIAHIQDAILANRSLADRLKDRGVDVRDVINAEQAADGSITFFTD